MHELHNNKIKFSNFPKDLYAVDVMFLQSSSPSGSNDEGKINFYGKHKLYEVKLEVAVLPNKMVINKSKHYPRYV